MKSKLVAACVLALLPAFVPAAPAADEKDVIDTAVALKEHTILLTALSETGLLDTLKGKGPVTVFAPTDAAFKKLSDDQLRAIVKEPKLLEKIVRAHLVAGKEVASTDLTALNGKELNGFKVAATRDGITVGGAKVTRADVRCSNGVIHVLDAVLVPAN
jgi:uncharacterized surface protein with fasciclin (FAS1) repeats